MENLHKNVLMNQFILQKIPVMDMEIYFKIIMEKIYLKTVMKCITMF